MSRLPLNVAFRTSDLAWLPLRYPALRTMFYICVLCWAATVANPPLALGQDTVVDEPALIAELIGQLNSDSYARRSAATERLAGLGQPAVAPLTKAVMAGNLETATRGIYILRNLAVEAEDDTISQAALESLKQIANTKDNVHSQVAIKTLGQLGVLQQQMSRGGERQQGKLVWWQGRRRLNQPSSEPNSNCPASAASRTDRSTEFVDCRTI